MILQEDQIKNYLGKNNLDSLGGKIRSDALAKLREYDKRTQADYSLTAIDYLFSRYQGQRGKSLISLANEVGISNIIVKDINNYATNPPIIIQSAHFVRNNLCLAFFLCH